MSPAELFYRFGVALCIGLLVGLQREHARGDPHSDEELLAGVRTFPLLAILGAIAAFLAAEANSVWLLIVPLLLAGALIVSGYVITAWRGQVGMTTEVAALLTILAGALCYYGRVAEAVALGVAIMALLAMRVELHQLAGRITREDFLATLKFGLITAVILPVVPNRSLGEPPFDVLNLYKIWLMVVLISGISFAGYLLMKIVGPKKGIGITGFLGGLVSSTAVTLSFSERSRDHTSLAKLYAIAIIVAWTTMFARVVVEVAVVNRQLLEELWVPMAAAFAAGIAYSALLYFRQSSDDRETMNVSNPFELGPAIRFGVLYALILLISRFAQLQFGEKGVYVSSVLAGLTDVDAITLSMAELSQSDGDLNVTVAARAVTLAAMSNTVVKCGLVLVTGGLALKRAVFPGFLLILIAGLVAVFV